MRFFKQFNLSLSKFKRRQELLSDISGCDYVKWTLRVLENVQSWRTDHVVVMSVCCVSNARHHCCFCGVSVLCVQCKVLSAECEVYPQMQMGVWIDPHLFEVHNRFLWIAIEPRKGTVSSPSTPWTNLTNRGC
jgi:hypothetical protein